MRHFSLKYGIGEGCKFGEWCVCGFGWPVKMFGWSKIGQNLVDVVLVSDKKFGWGSIECKRHSEDELIQGWNDNALILEQSE